MLTTIIAYLRQTISTVLRWKKTKRRQTNKTTPQDTPFAQALLHNPYLQSKALWNDVYGDLNQRYRRAWFLHLGLIAIIALLLMGWMVFASETKIRSVPFIVQGDEILTLHHTLDNQNPALRQTLAPYFAKQFIVCARWVSADRQVNRSNATKAYTFVANGAVSTLRHFYEQQLKRLHPNAVNRIEVTSVLSLSPQTFLLHWKEDWRSVPTGESIKTEYYVAELTYTYHAPSENPTILQSNPMGFYITSFSWSLDHTHPVSLGE